MAVVLVAASVLGTTRAAAAPDVVARTITRGLARSASFAVAPGGDIVFGERLTGWIKIWRHDRDRIDRFFQVPNVDADVISGRGLLSVTLDPEYPDEPYVYALATVHEGNDERIHVMRITDADGDGRDPTVLLDVGPAGEMHNGGKIAFGPDGLLYVVVGETDQPGLAQDLDVDRGKVLRISPDGSIPGDNPFGNRPVYAYGIRNSFGMAFDPQTGSLWETENGPECNDELNRIVAGGNYGWGPSETCSTPPAAPGNTNQDGPSPVLPERSWDVPIAPTGAAFCSGCGLGRRSEGALFMGVFNHRRIERITLTRNRRGVRHDGVIYSHPRPVLSVEASPTGRIYFCDSKGIYRLTRG